MSDIYYEWKTTNKAHSTIKELGEYNGEEEIILFCTQLSEEQYPRKKDRNRILNEWIGFLNSNPKAIKKIDIVGRMNQRLFDAVCSQKNLTELIIKWGSYPNLKRISSLQKLKYLSLCGGPTTKDLSPIGELHQLEVLILQNITGTTDYSAIAALHNIRQLGIHSSMYGVVKLDSLNFLHDMPMLKNFQTTGFRLLSHDYSPVLQLSELEVLSINMPTSDFKEWNAILAQKFADIPVNRHRQYAQWYKL